jgi:hypothetical protein
MTEKEFKKATESVKGGNNALSRIGLTAAEVEKLQPFHIKFYNFLKKIKIFSTFFQKFKK